MAGHFRSRAAPISLDDLVALNDELAALVRARVPLDSGLVELGRDLPGRLGRITTELGERISQGASLPDAIAESESKFPPVYRAVVQAGLRTNRLPLVLESLADSARRLAEVRRAVSLAMLYPLIVLLLAYALFLVSVRMIFPQFQSWYGSELPSSIHTLMRLGEHLERWAVVPPLVIIGTAGLWWLWASSSDSLGPLSRAFFWLPAVGRMMHCARTASFTEILALLLENQVPLDQAIVLAADAWGDRELMKSAARFSQLIGQGVNVSQDDPQTSAIPPLVRWLLLTSPPRTLVPMLRYTAETFHRRALRHADWLRLTFPIVATLVIGGSVTFVYALTLFMPFSELIQKLTAPFKV